MLGHSMIRILANYGDYELFGTTRSRDAERSFPGSISSRLMTNLDLEKCDALEDVFRRVRPNVVVNCVGLVKQVSEARDPLRVIPVNALLPHRLARLCEVTGARLIHISTDCVFSGEKGGYQETDPPDPRDLYGMSKYLGEVCDANSITLRTSIIGHGLNGSDGLLDWFLAQEGQCRGFRRAVFSGVPTVVLAQIVGDVVIPGTDLHGLYHVAADPIAKFDLLKLVSHIYGKSIEIIPDDTLIIDRSLNAARFRAATNYDVPEWPELIRVMHSHYLDFLN
jgi:dTDP-4-dehydrorhamnose reductase